MNIITNKKQHFSFSHSFFTLLYISVALFLPLILKGKTTFISYEQARQIAQKHVHIAPKTSTRATQTISLEKALFLFLDTPKWAKYWLIVQRIR